MKISELIKKLEEAKDEHGDIDVYFWPYDGQILPSMDDASVNVEEAAPGRKIIILDS